MTLRFRLLFGALALASVACGASSPGSPSGGEAGADASTDAPATMGAPDAFAAVPEAGAPAEGGSMCDRLKQAVDDRSALARACNPQGASECNAAVDGLCCTITVNASSNGAVADFEHAVNSYKAMCKPDCTRVLCGIDPPPSNICDQTTKTCH